jgi:hypothetical protein
LTAGRALRARLAAGAIVGAGAVFAVTGCSATTNGTAAGTHGPPSACATAGYSASAASGTIRCYLHALGTGDTTTACEQLSVHARAELLAEARASGLQGAINVSTPSSGCATVATVIQHCLDSLTPGKRAELGHRLRAAQVGAAQISGSIATVEVRTPAGATIRPMLVHGAGTWKIDSTVGAG